MAKRRIQQIATLGAILLLIIVSIMVTPPHPSSADSAVQIAPAIPSEPSTVSAGVPTRDVFYSSTQTFSYATGYVLLSTCSDGSCTIVADDAISLRITRPDSSVRTIELDFYTADFPPADLTDLFLPGVNTVEVSLIDLIGPVRGSPRPFYLVSSAAPPSFPTLRVEAPPAGTQYNYTNYAAYSRDPVNTFTGSFNYTHADVEILGRGPVPTFQRTYSSNDTRTGPMGPGWTHNYNTRLVSPSAGSPDIVLVSPQGRSDLYTSNGDNTYAPPTGVQTTLVKNGDGTYTATDKDLTKWVFDALGRLIRIEDRYGNISLLGYNADNTLATVSDPAGRGSLTFAYDGTGKLTGVSDWMSPARTVTFGYDGAGRLSSATDREGNTTHYAYDGSSQRLTTITDANGHVAVTNTYDSNGSVQTQKDAEGIATGQQTTFVYNTNGDGTKTTVVTYPTTSQEPAWHHIEEDTYDTQGRIIKHVSKPTSNSAEWITEQYTWDADSNKMSYTDGKNNTTTYCYDVNYAGSPVAGSHGNRTRQIDPAAESGAPRAVTLFKYDSKNNLVQTIAPKGVNGGASIGCSTNLSGSLNMQYTTDFEYDSTTQTKLLSTTARYTDPDTGAQTAITKYEYGDSNNPGSVSKIISPRGNTGSAPDYSFATTRAYYSGGSMAGMLQRETNPNGSITTYTYDAVGRLISRVDPNGNAAGGVASQHTWVYTYDREDRMRFTIAPAPTAGGMPLITETRYDGVGNPIVSIDANGQVKKSLYDARDNLSEVQESPAAWTDPSVVPVGLIRTVYGYDALGNMIRVTRAKSDASYERATDYAYDGLGRVRKEVQYPQWPSTGGSLITEYNYDKNSNRVTLKDPLNRVTTFGYDTRNLLRSITYSDGVTPNVTYNYDLNGNRQSMQDGTGTTSYTYDEFDRMLSTIDPSESGPLTVAYRYDLDGNRRKIVYPDGRAVSYTFDNGGRMQSLTDWQSRSVSYTYYPDDNLKSIANPNGTFSVYTYDNAQRLTDVWNKAGVNTISRHTYTVDSVGNRTRVDEVMPQNGAPKPPDPRRMLATSYGYDRLYRLTSESSADVAASYTYDPVGNRLRMINGRDDVTYVYDRADRLTRIGSTAVTVDAAGNMVARGKETYMYDQADRLTKSRMPQPSQYLFNGDGVRVKTDAGQGPLATHVYDVNGALPVLLFDGRRTYVWGVGLAFATDGNGTLEIYHTDGLGSVRAVTYANGNVTQNYQTDAFGVVVRRQGSSNQPFQYAGEARDKETEFTFLRSRNYDPSMGRFVQRDKFSGFVVEPQSLNGYTYVENSPTNSLDPSGRASSRILIASWTSDHPFPIDLQVPLVRRLIGWQPGYITRLTVATSYVGIQSNGLLRTDFDKMIHIGGIEFDYTTGELGSSTGPLGVTTNGTVKVETRVPLFDSGYSLTFGVEIDSKDVPTGQWLGAISRGAQNIVPLLAPLLAIPVIGALIL